jgi:hypothetical protein
MTTTVLDIIKDAMQTCGAIAMDEAPSSSDVSVCMTKLSFMLNQWAAQNLMVRATTGEDFTLIANKASYTIGIGGDFNTSKPLKIDFGYRRSSNNTDHPIEIITVQEYEGLDDKGIATGGPCKVAFDPGVTQQAVQTGTVLVYPIPDAAYTIHLHSEKFLTDFVLSSEAVTFEPMYFEPMSYGLAVRIWRSFRGKEAIPLDIVSLAAESKRVLENINSVTPPMATDIPGRKGGNGYNILSDV